MSRRATLIIGLIVVLLAAAPPPAAPIARWIADLASDDPAVWRRASDDLWHAGAVTIPALRAAMKDPDPDVVLRAAVLLARLEWGIRPETPAAVVVEIEKYRDGDEARRKEAVEKLARQGGPGFIALRRLLERERDPVLRQALVARVKALTVPAARDLIARGEWDEAERLLSVGLAGSLDQARDLAAFWLLSGRAEARARELTREADAPSARAAALLHRAKGDLATARTFAERAGVEVLAGVLGELEDYKGLVKTGWRPKSEAGRAHLAWRVGDRVTFDAVLGNLKPDDHWLRSRLLFEAGRFREAIGELEKVSPESACEVLAIQGRPLDALAVVPPSDPRRYVGLRHEQAAITHRLGEFATRDRFMQEAWEVIDRESRKASGGFDYHLLGARLEAGRRTGTRGAAIAEIGRVLDRLKPADLAGGTVIWQGASARDSEALTLWWECLRAGSADAPSDTLRRLDDWFVGGKPGADFDAMLKRAREWRSPQPSHQAGWTVAMALACERVGRLDTAEAILKEDAGRTKSAKGYERLGELAFARKRWADAAEAFGAATRVDPTLAAPTYLRGVALMRAGDEKAGRALIARARLLPLGDEETRYMLARALERAGLNDEATEEWRLLCRTGAFGSVYMANACGALAHALDRRGEHVEAARNYRLMLADVGFGDAGSFTDSGAYLRVPGNAHWNEALARLAEGKPDEAEKEARRLWFYLPENRDIIIDILRAYEKVGRSADADRLFDEQFAPMQRGCVQTPRSAHRHNQLAWIAARTGRRLDLALRHARWAVEREPTAGYLDTLAEVHFQRGDKAEALKAIDRAIALEPKKSYFAAQRKRIAVGDPKAAVPKE